GKYASILKSECIPPNIKAAKATLSRSECVENFSLKYLSAKTDILNQLGARLNQLSKKERRAHQDSRSFLFHTGCRILELLFSLLLQFKRDLVSIHRKN